MAGKPKGNNFTLAFVISIAVSTLMAAILLYLWYSYSPLLSSGMLKTAVLSLHITAIVIMLIGGIKYYSTLRSLAIAKFILSFAGGFMLPYIIMDMYLPPFVLLIYGGFVAAILTYSGYITLPSSKAGIIEVAIGSFYPVLGPVMFYLLYQVMNMPHIIEVAGICHANNLPYMKKGIISRIRRKIRRDMAAVARRNAPWRE